MQFFIIPDIKAPSLRPLKPRLTYRTAGTSDHGSYSSRHDTAGGLRDRQSGTVLYDVTQCHWNESSPLWHV